MILEPCLLFKLSALNKHNHRKKTKTKTKRRKRKYNTDIQPYVNTRAFFSKISIIRKTSTSAYQPVCGLISTLPGGMPAASKGSKKKLVLGGATCPLMPPSKERELLELAVG